MRDPLTLRILNDALRDDPLVLPPEALGVVPGATPWGDGAMLSRDHLDAILTDASWTVSNPRGPWAHAPHIVSQGLASPTASRPGDLDLSYCRATSPSDLNAGLVCYANPIHVIARAYRLVALRDDLLASLARRGLSL